MSTTSSSPLPSPDALKKRAIESDSETEPEDENIKRLKTSESEEEDVPLETNDQQSKEDIRNYYPDKEIEKELTCICCMKRYNIPKFLPCGNSICQDCEFNHFNQSADTSPECPICKSNHEKPQNGFPINIPLRNLLNKSAIKVYRGEIYENAFKKIAEIGRFYDDYGFNLENFEIIIRNECDILRFNIDLKTESLKDLLDKNRDELLNQIKTYELEALENSKNLAACFKKQFQKLIYESRVKYNQWANKLNQANITDYELQELLEEATLFRSRLDVYEVKINNLVFSKQKLFFNECDQRLQPVIGKLMTTSIPNFNYENFQNPKESIKITFEAEHMRSIQPIGIQLDNGTFCVIYSLTLTVRDILIKFKLYSENGTLINVHEEYKCSDGDFKVLKMKNRILLYFKRANKNIIRIFDESLTMKCEAKTEYDALALYTNEDYFYLYVQSSSSFSTIYKLTEQNNTIKLINRETITIRNGKIFLGFNRILNFHSSKLEIYDFNTRGLIFSKEMDSKYNNDNFIFQLTSADTFCVVDKINRSFKLFDFNLELLVEFEIKQFSYVSWCSFTDSSRLMIIDYNTKVLLIL